MSLEAVGRGASLPCAGQLAPIHPALARHFQDLSPMADDLAARSPGWHATTILMVRKGGKVVIGGDGQVSIGQTVVKGNARKVRRLAKGEVIAGFAGATADAFTLFERLEAKLEQYPGQLARACVELGQGLAHRPLSAPARGDAARRRQERRPSSSSGTGDVLEPEGGRVRRGDGDRLRRQLRARRGPRAACRCNSTRRRSCAARCASPPTSASTPTPICRRKPLNR